MRPLFMRKASLVILLLIGVGLSTQSVAQTVSEQQRKEIAQIVAAQADQGRVAAENLEGPEQVFWDVLPGEDAIFVRQGDFQRSRQTIWNRVPPKSGLTKLSIIVDERHVYVMTPTSAVLSERGHFTSYHKSGKESLHYYALTIVYAKIEGAWKMVHGHQSFPPQAPNSTSSGGER